MEPGVAMSYGTPTPFIVRVLSGIGAIVVFVIGLVVSFGAVLGGPLGIWLVSRRARRRDRQPSRIAMLFGAVSTSSLAAALLWSALLAFAPRPTTPELEAAVKQQSQSSAKVPDWYVKMFPQSAQADSATERLIQSPGFIKATVIFVILFIAVFFGVLGGVAAWGGHALLRIALTPPPPQFDTSPWSSPA